MELADRVVVVTGGASGIGRALAERFARERPRGIVLGDLDGEGAERVADGLPDALGLACDVTDDAQVGALLASAEERFGPVDVFCANAGIGTGASLDAPDETWRAAYEVNVHAHVLAARRLVPGWLERGEGYFVTTASAAGLLTQVGDGPYAVSKHGAVAFAEWLSVTYGDRGVRVSCLCPMGVDTPLLRGGLGLGDEEGLGARVVAAAGAILDPVDVADAVVQTMAAETFLVLPHPEVLEFFRRKAADYDRWLAGMRRLQAAVARA